MPVRIVVCICAMVAMALVACSTGSLGASTAAQTDYDRLDEVIFTPSDWAEALPADLYVPKGNGPWPAVVLIYGGSWGTSDHRRQMRRHARELATRGYAVMNISYRGAPDYRYPSQVEDVREAVKWLRAHAEGYRVDPKRVAVYGFSSGGHLAAMAATLDGPPEVRVQAAVIESGPSDLTLFQTGEILPQFLGVNYSENPAFYYDASPVAHVTRDDPPFFIFHGTGDKTVPPEHATRLDAALTKAGVRHQLRWVEGRGHGTMLFFNGDAENAAIDFLDSILRPVRTN